ncbi:Alpha N-terminal protein methyltransferase [Apiospora saccharicola]|uniref:Alpha N-terminal protein methyltransferase 1 n=1 Tax=Apiospora saccharicola TaxID=335842 RepID=A0ABR1UI38_9PEZI
MGPAPTTRTTRGAAAAAAAADEAAANATTIEQNETTTAAVAVNEEDTAGEGDAADAADAEAPPPDSLIRTENGLQYWSGIDADVNGMLGGFPSISAVDLRGSRAFLVKLGIGKTKGLHKVERALEGGAGIGRITQGLLLDIASTVDVVEPIAKFTEALSQAPGVGQIYNMGLEEWPPSSSTSTTTDDTTTTPSTNQPQQQKYNLIWLQWCVGHLTDTQLVAFLQRCRDVLVDSTPESPAAIVVKENNTTTAADLFDDLDSSVTRTDEKFRALFREAGLRLVRTELQNGLPKGLYPVRMYALKV